MSTLQNLVNASFLIFYKIHYFDFTAVFTFIVAERFQKKQARLTFLSIVFCFYGVQTVNVCYNVPVFCNGFFSLTDSKRI